MATDIEKLQQAINQSLTLIDDVNETELAASLNHVEYSESILPSTWNKAKSLLAQCESACQRHAIGEKPTIRVVHHFACSGGSLISKCLSAMPNVFLLSEVHPYTNLHLGSGKPKYLPSDIISLTKYTAVPSHRTLARKIFADSVVSTYQHISKRGGTLILRDHSHSDFCVGRDIAEVGAVTEALSEHFDIKALITVRDPIDSYISLQENNWVHFTPPSFEEYCRRYNFFMDCYSNAPVVRYEDFVDSPEPVMETICDALDLQFNAYFEDIFDIFSVTGDSGRSQDDLISHKSRKDVSPTFKNEILESESYAVFSKSNGYCSD